jgi:hypothetical protein
VCYCSWKSVALLLLTDPIGSLGTVEMGTGQTTGVSRYIKGVTLGEGTYGVVFKAIDRVVQYCLLKSFEFGNGDIMLELQFCRDLQSYFSSSPRVLHPNNLWFVNGLLQSPDFRW